MIRLLLAFLSTLLAAWYIAASIKQYGPGYVLVYFNHYSVETSVWIGLLCVGVLALVFYVLLRVVEKIMQLSWTSWQWQDGRKKTRWLRAINAYLQDDLLTTQQMLKNTKQFPALILALKSELYAGNIEQAQRYLQTASQCEDRHDFTLALAHFDIEYADKNYEKAAVILENLQKDAAKDARILSRAVKLYCELGKTAALEALLPHLLKNQAVVYAQWQQEWLEKAGRYLLAHYLQQTQQEPLDSLWLQLSRSSAKNALLADYCEALMALKEEKKARKLLEKRLQAQFDENCVVAYAKLTIEVSEQLDYLQSREALNPNNAKLLLALGIVYLKNKQWQQAKQSIEQSIAQAPCPQAYYYLSRYYAARGDERNRKT